MRAMWKGAVAFGLVNVPVKLYSATGQHDISLHLVHREDAGRIRYRKTCSVCGEEVPQDEIARAHTTDDGELVMLSDEDLDSLPVTTDREIEVHEFVPADQVDPIMFDRTYYLEPEAKALKPYALLRGALEQTDRMAVVMVTLRRRETMAVLRVRDDVIVMQTMLWPDEVREAAFDVLERDVEVRPQELQMAASLVESMAADFDPSQFEDRWTEALKELIVAKTEDGDAKPVPLDRAGDDGDAQIVDLMAALRASVERTGTARKPPAVASVPDDDTPGEEDASTGSAPASKATAKKPAARKTAAAKPATARPAAEKTTPAKPAAEKTAAAKPAAAGKPAAAKTSAAKTAAAKAAAGKPAAAKRTAKKAAVKAAPAKKTAGTKATATKAAQKRASSSAASKAS